MTTTHELDDLDLVSAILKKEWRITIQCDHCMYIRKDGEQRFRALEGSHAGNEGTIQNTACNEIVFTIPTKIETLEKVYEVLFRYGVQEDPDLHVFGLNTLRL